jgi:hypothetical protein
MGVTYTLYNLDRKECISYYPAKTGTKLLELSGTNIAGNITNYYMLTHLGDRITFLPDDYIPSWFSEGPYANENLLIYKDVTREIIAALIENGVLRDDGIEWIDQDEDLYFFDLANVWDPKTGNE